MSRAPERFVAWLTENVQTNGAGREYRYHPRSPSHSKALCSFLLEDIVAGCEAIGADASAGRIAYGIEHVMEHPHDPANRKTLDLAIGTALSTAEAQPGCSISAGEISAVRFTAEAKSCMTEHSKSKPRLFDELNSSHTIVHAAYPEAIATGLVIINIAPRFVSPLRQNQKSKRGQLEVTEHDTPACALDMIEHLRRLRLASAVGEYGFDAFAIVVIDCDNIGPAKLWTEPPAPQPGDRLHYESYLHDVCTAYEVRFGRA